MSGDTISSDLGDGVRGAAIGKGIDQNNQRVDLHLPPYNYNTETAGLTVNQVLQQMAEQQRQQGQVLQSILIEQAKHRASLDALWAEWRQFKQHEQEKEAGQLSRRQSQYLLVVLATIAILLFLVVYLLSSTG